MVFDDCCCVLRIYGDGLLYRGKWGSSDDMTTWYLAMCLTAIWLPLVVAIVFYLMGDDDD